MKRTILTVFTAASVAAMSLAGCSSKADVASQNLSTEADNFQIMRQVVFYNGITGDYIAEVTGRCSIGNYDRPGEVSITCEVAKGKFIKNYLHMSDNVTWFALQTSAVPVDVYRYKIIWRPSTIVPDPQFDLGSGN